MDHSRQQFEALYREAGPSLLAYFRGRPSLAVQAEDLLQDTFVRALRHPGRMAAAVTPRAYLYGIARHVGIDALRRLHPSGVLPETVAAPESEEDGRLEDMREAIGRLPEAQREALLLKLRHELSYEEIADVLGIPVGTVRSRLHAAVHSLRTILNPNPGTP